MKAVIRHDPDNALISSLPLADQRVEDIPVDGVRSASIAARFGQGNHAAHSRFGRCPIARPRRRMTATLSNAAADLRAPTRSCNALSTFRMRRRRRRRTRSRAPSFGYGFAPARCGAAQRRQICAASSARTATGPRVLGTKDRAFGEFRRASARMTELNVIAGQARERASAADERAAALEKEAAEARLKLAQITMPRHLRPEQIEKLKPLLMVIPNKGKVVVKGRWPDEEALSFTTQISEIMSDAGFEVIELNLHNTFSLSATLA